MIRRRLLELSWKVEVLAQVVARKSAAWLRERGVRITRSISGEVLLTGYRGRTRQVWEEVGDDQELTELFSRLPPFVRQAFLRDWKKGESRELLFRAYAMPVAKPRDYTDPATLEKYLVKGTEWERPFQEEDECEP